MVEKKDEFEVKLGDRFMSRNKMVGVITDIRGVWRLVVRDEMGVIRQTVNPKNIELEKFERITDAN